MKSAKLTVRRWPCLPPRPGWRRPATKSRSQARPRCCPMPPSSPKPLARIPIFRRRWSNRVARPRAEEVLRRGRGQYHRRRQCLAPDQGQREGGLRAKAAGVTEIMEVRIGYDGIVFASGIDGKDFAFTAADWFNALPPRWSGTGGPEPLYRNGPRSAPTCPIRDILAFIPGTGHGTREVFEEKVIAAGCRKPAPPEVFASERATRPRPTGGLHGAAHRWQVGRYRRRLYRDAGPHPVGAKNGIGVFGLSF